jgi:hypothetical protein
MYNHFVSRQKGGFLENGKKGSATSIREDKKGSATSIRASKKGSATSIRASKNMCRNISPT